MLKSGVPQGAVIQKMIVFQKMKAAEATEIVESYLQYLNPSKNCDENKSAEEIILISENIIDLSHSSSKSSHLYFSSSSSFSSSSFERFLDSKKIDHKKIAVYKQMIKVGMKKEQVQQRMKIEGIASETSDDLIDLFYDEILSTIASTYSPNPSNSQNYYGEKLYRKMVEAGVPIAAVHQRMIVDKLLPEVADRLLQSIAPNSIVV